MGSADKVIKVILAIVFGVLYFTAAVTGTQESFCWYLEAYFYSPVLQVIALCKPHLI